MFSSLLGGANDDENKAKMYNFNSFSIEVPPLIDCEMVGMQ